LPIFDQTEIEVLGVLGSYRVHADMFWIEERHKLVLPLKTACRVSTSVSLDFRE